MGATHVRIARPTDKLEKVVAFYHNALGLPIIGSFADHDGYNGYMLGIKGAEIHLEFTQLGKGEPCPAPSADNLLVLYFATPIAYNEAIELMESFGHTEVEPENPYWLGRSKTYADPDGWRVVLHNGLYAQAASNN